MVDDQQQKEKRFAALAQELSAAEGNLSQAKSGYEVLQQKHAAEELKHALKAGEPCPVCEQSVKKVPAFRKHTSLDQAKKAIEKCDKTLTRLVKEQSSLEAELGHLKSQIERLDLQIDEFRASIDDAATVIRATLKKAPDENTESELKSLSELGEEMQRTGQSIADQIEKARDRESTSKDTVQGIDRAVSSLQSEVAALSNEGARLKTQTQSLKSELGPFADLSRVQAELKKQDDARTSLETLTRSKETESQAMSAAKDELQEALINAETFRSRTAELISRCDKLREKIEEIIRVLGLRFPALKMDATKNDPADQLEDLRATSQERLDERQREVSRLEQQAEAIKEQMKRAAEMQAEIDEHRKQAATAHDLALMLKGDRFIAFIQQEAYRRLAIDGSSHLNTLSSGRYSFGFEKDEFVVLDHWNADESRPVTTLSGGESFLASLALALSLAEGLSGLSHGHGRFALESLFLDEGFGTLDAETLDVVLQGIESLGVTNRLVGIVSHIPELADRMPTRINVRKAVGGSTIEAS
jgi:exonuclease SbcC